MASLEIFDLEALLAPMPGEHPTGEDVRHTVYDVITEARRADDTGSQGDWKRKVKESDWAGVIKVANEVLASQSKDLKVAAWLTEALIKEHGFSALAFGFRLLSELQIRFWESLYPVIDNGDLGSRLGSLTWLNANLPRWIRSVPLTACDGANYDWWQWRAAVETKGELTVKLDTAVKSTPRDFYEVARDDLSDAQKELEHFEQVVDDKFGKAAPSFSKVKEAVEECQTVIDSLLKKKGEAEPNQRSTVKPSGLRALFNKFVGLNAGADSQTQEGAREVSDSHAGADDMAEVTVQKNQIVPPVKTTRSTLDEPESREEAFQRLEVIARYLKRIEPHSPVSYLIERAIRWGNMPLESWLNEVIQNEDLLKRLRDTLGIKEKSAT